MKSRIYIASCSLIAAASCQEGVTVRVAVHETIRLFSEPARKAPGTRFVVELRGPGGDSVAGVELEADPSEGARDISLPIPSNHPGPFAVYAGVVRAGITSFSGCATRDVQGQPITPPRAPVEVVLRFTNGPVDCEPDERAAPSKAEREANLADWQVERFRPHWQAVVYTGERFVAVGSRGATATSRDGLEWTTSRIATGVVLQSVASSGTGVVAVGTRWEVNSDRTPYCTGSGLFTSMDGTWSEPTGPWRGRKSPDLVVVVWDGSKFVAYGEECSTGQVNRFVSTDGTTWTASRAEPALNVPTKLIVTPGLLVGVRNGAVVTSSDGITWSRRTDPTQVGAGLNDVTFAASRFVAVGSKGVVMTSEDGLGWTLAEPVTSETLEAVACGPSTCVAVGRYGVVLTSPDGATWTAQPTAVTSHLSGVVFGAGRFVAAGDDETILTSPDGFTWTRRLGTPEPVWPLTGVAHGGGVTVTVGSSFRITRHADRLGERFGFYSGYHYPATILTATGAMGWTTTLLDSEPADRTLSNVTYGDSRFVAVGFGGSVVSDDGVQWRDLDLNASAVTFGGQYVAVSRGGAIHTSPDGLSWTALAPQTDDDLFAVTHGPAGFVAVGEWGTILTSSGGMSWNVREAHTQSWLLGVAFGAGRYVIVGEEGLILSSSDGVRWTPQRSGIAANLMAVSGGEKGFVAVGFDGSVIVSVDGTVWDRREVLPGNGLLGVSFVDRGAIAVGQSGAVVRGR